MKTVALGMAITALGLFGAAGCARERGDLAGTATTTSAITSSTLNAPTGCSTNLPEVFLFDDKSADLSPDERVEVQSWAQCLQRTGMTDSTVVLLGPGSPQDDTLFQRRAEAVREELVRRGVERSRIIIGTANAARQGGRLGPANTVRMEISGMTNLRDLGERR